MTKTILTRLAIWSLPAVVVTLLVTWGVIKLTNREVVVKAPAAPAAAPKAA
jgi:DUF1365 family protein